MRILRLTNRFWTTRRIYAPHGSPEDGALRIALIRLADEHLPLPLVGDEEALRTPFKVIWSHRVPGVPLVLTYAVTPELIEVHTVHPVWRSA